MWGREEERTMARTLVSRLIFTLLVLGPAGLAGCRSWDRYGGSSGGGSGCGGGCCRGVAAETEPLWPRGSGREESAGNTEARPRPDAP